MAAMGYSLVLIFLILEMVFMFFVESNRYNGSLSSRSWFYKYYDYNSEGYRDHEHNWEAVQSKTKVLVLGDSFVEGHGIEDPNDRFGEVMASHLDDSYQVFNLGHGGSDVRMALDHLRSYPVQPDLLVYSYYPNDMENDCELAGREIKRIPHMEDVPGIFRYFVKRSYLMNYIYWKYPHGSDLFNYRDYLAGATAIPPRWTSTWATSTPARLCRFPAIPMVTVVWPFLEAIDSTRFAAEPIVAHLDSTGGMPLDVGAMLQGRPLKS